ncbi:arylamine N-acetyltransferase [Bacillus atrophaeus]|uniref:arylamine N-acetyltransferase n=1 Tax=Bacillus atrophaeus TaxID=1452 RepID=UPI002E1F4E0F|nr:arylamine N-acetyltransferase [Bacillus atrophaeus]
MNEFLKECFTKIGWDQDTLAFDDLPRFLTKLAYQLPFENRAVLEKHQYDMSRDGLWNHIVKERHGGLCYDLNGFLYYVLYEAGFDVRLISGTVYTQKEGQWALEGTHAVVLLSTEEGDYITDIGFGVNLALQPIPLSGQTVEAATGKYRIIEQQTEMGSHVLEMDKGEGWQTGYAFTLKEIEADDLSAMRDIIYHHDLSPFNKKPLASKLTPDGYLVLTEDHLTVNRKNGECAKENIHASDFGRKLEEHFFKQ